MLRKILAVVIGMLVGAMVVALIDMLGHTVYPFPEGLDMDDSAAVAAYLAGAPLGAMLFVVLAWVMGSFVAGAVATLICNDGKSVYALICGVLLLIAGITTLLMIAHPTWMWIVSAFAYIPPAWLGYRLARKKGR